MLNISCFTNQHIQLPAKVLPVKIRGNPLFQVLGLTDIEQLPLLVVELVNTGLRERPEDSEMYRYL